VRQMVAVIFFIIKVWHGYIQNKNELSAGFHAGSFRERNDAILF
jgi:hypothetical protein